MPVLWFEQHVVADDSLAYLVKLILAASTAGQILGIVFVMIGVTLILFACPCTRDKFAVKAVEKQKTETQMTTIIPESLPLMKN
jgi:hypothetical protein